mgnify:CR=1 FL=1
MMADVLLKGVPDYQDSVVFQKWVKDSLDFLDETQFIPSSESLQGQEIFSFLAEDLLLSKPVSNRYDQGGDPLGWYGRPEWRRLVSAAFLADWIVYRTPEDRVNF